MLLMLSIMQKANGIQHGRVKTLHYRLIQSRYGVSALLQLALRKFLSTSSEKFLCYVIGLLGSFTKVIDLILRY